jgi:hypothetical protein
MNFDRQYLAEIGPLLPVASTRWGVAFDGQRLAMVEVGPGAWKRDESPMVFWAAMFPGCTINRAVRLFDEIAHLTGLLGLTLVMRGNLGRYEVFVRHLHKLDGRHGVRLFSQGGGRWFEDSEALAAVADDRFEGLIRIAPEFENRPERVMLDEEIGLIDPDSKLTLLQEAFVFGLGYWSCVERRPKFYVGPSSFRVY